MNIRETVTNVLSCVQCIAIMVLLGVGLDEKKTPCAAVLFHDLSSSALVVTSPGGLREQHRSGNSA